MVKRSVLEKLSNKDLLRYTSEETRSVPEAIEMAFDILKKRGYFFSETEIVKINQLIASRKQEEPDYKSLNTWDIDEDAEKASVSFYSQKAIWYFSILFGLFTGAILLAINLFTLSKKKEAWATLLFGFGYTIALILVYNEFKDYFDQSRFTGILLYGIGAAILQFGFWDQYLKGIKYKKRSIIAPLMICLVVVGLIILRIIIFLR
ncbi:hypothetical protein [Sphingobacterium sp. UME9]|uniref:hypothetical protein n=1 Tax=Sphingobacterium sp. UME9 TaxID=1862316 RepID=UPI0016019010|nr:hypothetical protein [Sphingobacterium sp. UME9]MBB1645024.1 hypothetical protein [Sphingobacterium sp. UME9]